MAENASETNAGTETESAPMSEASSGAPQADSSQVKPYDFTRPATIPQHQVDSLNRVHEQFAESLGALLSGQLRCAVEVELKSVEQVDHDQFIQAEQGPRCLFHVSIADLEASVILEMGVDLALLIVDRMLGGKGEVYGDPRELTCIEQRVTGQVVSGLLQHFDTSWQHVYEIKTVLQGVESDPELFHMGPTSSVIVLVSFDVKIGESLYQVKVFYPGFTLGVLMRRPEEEGQAPVASEQEQEEVNPVRARLEQTPITLTVILAETTLSVKDLLSLQEGDLIALDKSIHDEVLIRVEDRVKFTARPGLVGNRKAVQIAKPVRDEGGADDDR